MTLGLGLLAFAKSALALPPDCVPRQFITYGAPQQTLSAVFYFPWHTAQLGDCATADCTNAPHANAWCCCISLPKPGHPVPVEGFYSSDDAGVTSRHLDVIAQHGIDIVAAAWTGQLYVESNLVNHIVPALAPRGLRYVLLYDFKIAYDGIGLDFDLQGVRTRFINDLTRFATDPAFFHNSSYLKLDNQPVIYLYVTREPDLKGTVKPECGNKNCLEFAFDQARAAVQAAGFPDLYIVADHIYWSGTDYDKLSLMHAKAATAFAPVTDDRGIPQSSAQRPIRLWADDMSGLYSSARTSLAQTATIDLMPGVFVQFNDTGFGVNEACHLAGTQASQKYNPARRDGLAAHDHHRRDGAALGCDEDEYPAQLHRGRNPQHRHLDRLDLQLQRVGRGPRVARGTPSLLWDPGDHMRAGH